MNTHRSRPSPLPANMAHNGRDATLRIDDLLEGIGKQLDGGPESQAAISRRMDDNRKRKRANPAFGGGRGGGSGADGGATGGD